MLSSPDSVFDMPARPLFELPASLWGEFADIVDQICDAMFGAAGTVVDATEGLLTARIKIPLLTKVIEKTILGLDGQSRDLNLLRLFALAAAIPTELARQGSSDSDTAQPSAQMDAMSVEPASDDDDSGQARRQYRSLVRASVGLGLANWTLWSARALSETVSVKDKAGDSLAILQSFVQVAAAVIDLYRLGPTSD